MWKCSVCFAVSMASPRQRIRCLQQSSGSPCPAQLALAQTQLGSDPRLHPCILPTSPLPLTSSICPFHLTSAPARFTFTLSYLTRGPISLEAPPHLCFPMLPRTSTHYPLAHQVVALLPAQSSPHRAVLILEGWNPEGPKTPSLFSEFPAPQEATP